MPEILTSVGLAPQVGEESQMDGISGFLEGSHCRTDDFCSTNECVKFARTWKRRAVLPVSLLEIKPGFSQVSTLNLNYLFPPLWQV